MMMVTTRVMMMMMKKIINAMKAFFSAAVLKLTCMFNVTK